MDHSKMQSNLDYRQGYEEGVKANRDHIRYLQGQYEAALQQQQIEIITKAQQLVDKLKDRKNTLKEENKKLKKEKRTLNAENRTLKAENQRYKGAIRVYELTMNELNKTRAKQAQ